MFNQNLMSNSLFSSISQYYDHLFSERLAFFEDLLIASHNSDLNIMNDARALFYEIRAFNRSSLLSYTAQPQNSLNQRLIKLSYLIAQYFKCHPIQILMPEISLECIQGSSYSVREACLTHFRESLEDTVRLQHADSSQSDFNELIQKKEQELQEWSPIIYKNLTEYSLEEILTNFIEGQGGYYLIPVSILAEQGITDRANKIPNYYYDFQRANLMGSGYLSEQEVYRLYRYSHQTFDLLSMIREYDAIAKSDYTLISQLEMLLKSMSFNKKSGGVGSEFDVGSGFYNILMSFQKYYDTKLTQDQKNSIPNTLKDEIEFLIRLGHDHHLNTDATRETQSCMDRRYTSLATLLDTHKAAIMQIKPADESSRLEELIKIKNDYMAACNNLKQSILPGGYDRLGITSYLISHFAQHITVSTEADLVSLFCYSAIQDEEIQALLQNPILKASILTYLNYHSIDDLVSNLIFLFLELSPSHIKVLLKVYPEIPQALKKQTGAFSQIISALISQQDKIIAIFNGSHPYLCRYYHSHIPELIDRLRWSPDEQSFLHTVFLGTLEENMHSIDDCYRVVWFILDHEQITGNKNFTIKLRERFLPKIQKILAYRQVPKECSTAEEYIDHYEVLFKTIDSITLCVMLLCIPNHDIKKAIVMHCFPDIVNRTESVADFCNFTHLMQHCDNKLRVQYVKCFRMIQIAHSAKSAQELEEFFKLLYIYQDMHTIFHNTYDVKQLSYLVTDAKSFQLVKDFCFFSDDENALALSFTPNQFATWSDSSENFTYIITILNGLSQYSLLTEVINQISLDKLYAFASDRKIFVILVICLQKNHESKIRELFALCSLDRLVYLSHDPYLLKMILKYLSYPATYQFLQKFTAAQLATRCRQSAGTDIFWFIYKSLSRSPSQDFLMLRDFINQFNSRELVRYSTDFSDLSNLNKAATTALLSLLTKHVHDLHKKKEMIDRYWDVKANSTLRAVVWTTINKMAQYVVYLKSACSQKEQRALLNTILNTEKICKNKPIAIDSESFSIVMYKITDIELQHEIVEMLSLETLVTWVNDLESFHQIWSNLLNFNDRFWFIRECIYKKSTLMFNHPELLEYIVSLSDQDCDNTLDIQSLLKNVIVQQISHWNGLRTDVLFPENYSLDLKRKIVSFLPNKLCDYLLNQLNHNHINEFCELMTENQKLGFPTNKKIIFTDLQIHTPLTNTELKPDLQVKFAHIV